MNTAIAALAAIVLAAYFATRKATSAGGYIDPTVYGPLNPAVPGTPGDETAWAPTGQIDWGNIDTMPVEGEDQAPSFVEQLYSAVQPGTFWPVTTETGPMQSTNTRAFLDMIAYAEGTTGPDGYRAIFGYPAPGRMIDSYADHPRKLFTFTNSKGAVLKTSAAGRYQFLTSTWDDLRAKLNLPDFGPASQDAAAIELIRQRGALNDVQAGRIAAAISKCKSTWASLPGAGYNQPERNLATLLTAYTSAGGAILQA